MEGWMRKWPDDQINGYVHGSVDSWMDGRTDRWMDGQ